MASLGLLLHLLTLSGAVHAHEPWQMPASTPSQSVAVDASAAPNAARSTMIRRESVPPVLFEKGLVSNNREAMAAFEKKQEQESDQIHTVAVKNLAKEKAETAKLANLLSGLDATLAKAQDSLGKDSFSDGGDGSGSSSGSSGGDVSASALGEHVEDYSSLNDPMPTADPDQPVTPAPDAAAVTPAPDAAEANKNPDSSDPPVTHAPDAADGNKDPDSSETGQDEDPDSTGNAKKKAKVPQFAKGPHHTEGHHSNPTGHHPLGHHPSGHHSTGHHPTGHHPKGHASDQAQRPGHEHGHGHGQPQPKSPGQTKVEDEETGHSHGHHVSKGNTRDQYAAKTKPHHPASNVHHKAGQVKHSSGSGTHGQTEG